MNRAAVGVLAAICAIAFVVMATVLLASCAALGWREVTVRIVGSDGGVRDGAP